MTLSDAPDVLTVPQAAELLHLGRRQTYDAVQRGDIPSIRIGRSIRISRVALERLLDPEQRDAPGLDSQGASDVVPTGSWRTDDHERA